MELEYKCTQCYLAGRTDFMKPPRCFGAYTPSLLLSVVVADGAWTRCLPCREVANRLRAGNGLQAIPAQMTGDRGACGTGEQLRCSVCETSWPLEYYSKSAVHHKNRNKAPVCNVCDETFRCVTCKQWRARRAFRDGSDVCRSCETIRCVGCEADLLRSAFDMQSVKHNVSHQQRVICIECRKAGKSARVPKTVRCNGCGEEKDRAEYTAGNLKSYRDKRTQTFLVCRSCTDLGRTTHDVQLYNCSSCRSQYGRGSFDPKQLANFRARGHCLVCKACRGHAAQRLLELKTLVATSSFRCRCRLPIHSQKCPLNITAHGRRWPGMDKGVTENDEALLCREKPVWWMRALGK